MASPQIGATLSRSACHACRRGKRRCDRALPACQLCIRKDVRCGYPKPPAKRSYTPEIAWDEKSMQDDSSPSSYRYFNQPDQTSDSESGFDRARAVQFLAPGIFRGIRLEIPCLGAPIPRDVAAFVGDTQQVRDIASVLFSHDGSWLPIVCRKHFFSAALNPLSPRRAEGTLLALCMKLYSTTSVRRDGSQKTALYRTAKRYHSEIEASGLISLHVLQAMIFIALYEIGHAIYPAAYLTVGACARYGVALGLDRVMTDNSDFNKSWMEVEEKRRSWWGVLALDRRLATSDPEIDYYLPIDDQAFLESV
ncbi:transcriptional regulatory [Trichoderma arundinaceum]|uniref:Transcriptional regulatory n=1 Tax=Trichoderma arundinaceum TaxID=490622 RepID=A0A395NN74_TRIAR|nr:transcriptional regulatory [Trichoderma arundinaceum]